MNSKNILLGVSGGIACYKSLEIIRQLKKLDFTTNVIMTKNAQNFVKPLTFATLSQNKVTVDLFDADAESLMSHIKLAQSSNIFLVAPATANIIAKLTYGIADDILSTSLLATSAQIILVPAMNNLMWESQVVQQNIAKLIKRGVLVIDPDEGSLACETIGKGRLASIENIINQVLANTEDKSLTGQKALVTMGATMQPIDPFRFISNYSSGKMGYEIALTLKMMGANVSVICANTYDIPGLFADEIVHIKTTDEMHTAFFDISKNQNIIIQAAAVSDYATKYSTKKLKGDNLDLKFKKTDHILEKFAKVKSKEVTLVGFSAETDNLITNTKKKFDTKNIDLIVANQIGLDDSGFGSDYIKANFIRQHQVTKLPLMTKKELSQKIGEVVSTIRKEKNY